MTATESIDLRPTCVYCRRPHCDHDRSAGSVCVPAATRLRSVQGELAAVRKEFTAAMAVVQAKNLAVYAKCDPASNDATVSLAEIVAGVADELDRRHKLYLDEFQRGTTVANSTAEIGEQCERLIDENDRLSAALLQISQVRHVSGSAQGAFRSNLRIADAALAGADMSDLATVEAVANGTWEKRSDRTADGGQPSGSDRWRLLGRAAAAPEGVR